MKPLFFLLVLFGFLFFAGLGDRDLLSSHEARAAQNGQMIVSDGCWGLPRLFDQHLEMQKPPLYYWLVALFGHLFGGHVNAWAVRLPAAVSALGCVLFLYYLGRKTGRPLAGFLAALVLGTCLHFTWLARIGRIDMPLTLAVTLACGGFYLGSHAMRATTAQWARPWLLLGYVSLALGILLKGPIALILAGAIVGIFALTEWWYDRQTIARPPASSVFASLWWGLPLVILIAAPWFIWANWQTNNQVWEIFFWYHNLERGLGASETLASHPFWFYLPRAIVDLFPWSLALVPAAWFFTRRVGWRQDAEARYGALWFLITFLVLSLMSFKRADYLLPAYPGLALFLGCMAERCIGPGGLLRLPAKRGRLLVVGVSAMLVCCVVGWSVFNFWIVRRQEQAWPYYELARDIRARTDMPVIFFRAESHVLAFHVGRPLDTILEWENLDVWASQKAPIYIVMPAECASAWPQHLTKGYLEEVFRTSDHAWGRRERPLVVMRSCPNIIAE